MTRDLTLELKALRLHGMAGAWAELQEQGRNAGLDSSRWLLEHLLQAEDTDRAMRSVSHRMHAAKFPMHRDLAGFDFTASPVLRARELLSALLAAGRACRIQHRHLSSQNSCSSTTCFDGLACPRGLATAGLFRQRQAVGRRIIKVIGCRLEAWKPY